MSLPNPSMSFSPFAILTAEELNDMVENIEYLGTIVDGVPPSGPGGWEFLALNPNSISYLGNHSYQMVYNGSDLTGTVSPGSRIRTTRTVAAPTQCTSLNGTNQYWVKSGTINKMTFTDDFVVSAWVKLSSYTNDACIVSRLNGTQGFDLVIDTVGRLTLSGRNAGLTNFRRVQSYQSVPLNKWVHVTAQLDMSAFTATATTNYIMIDGVDVPCAVLQSGTNPTALVQAGNLEIGSYNGGTAGSLFPGKIAQVAVYSAKVTQANILATISQGLLGTETSLASAYSFNGVVTDLNITTPNDLSVGGGSAVATIADSPFGGQASGLISSTLDYGIVQSATFSTNTTLVVQVPEGCTIPTSGGVSAVSYSSAKVPYGFPADEGRWTLVSRINTSTSGGIAGLATWTATPLRLSIPIGNWVRGYQVSIDQNSTVSGTRRFHVTLADVAPTNGIYTTELDSYSEIPGTTDGNSAPTRFSPYTTLTMAANIFYIAIRTATGTETFILSAVNNPSTIYAKNALL